MSDTLRVGVLGAGSWGMALAHLAASKGHDVTLWAFEAEVAEGIQRDRKNPFFLSDLTLGQNVRATTDLQEAVHRAELVLFVIPAQLERSYIKKIRDFLPEKAPLVICAKGIECETLDTMDEVFRQELPGKYHKNVAVLSGPSFAAEVAANMPTNVTVAAADIETARRVQSAMGARHFRVYTTDDVLGVELGGALKNVIAIAVGAADGLRFGPNTRAAIITRGLAEITRLAVHLGGRPETMLGLAGVGDLILTCTGDLSRNRQVGQLLAKGQRREQIVRNMKMVAEGVTTAQSARALAVRAGVDAPITEQVYAVLWQDKTVGEAMAALQDRPLTEEWRTSAPVQSK